MPLVFQQTVHNPKGITVPNLFRRAVSPCFAFRPDIFLRACWRKLRARPARCVVKTAWGDQLEVDARKFIGAHVYMRGVHELPVCEMLWRLAGPGDAVVDVGANIGVMTSVLSRRVGNRGRVFAFEAHPEIFRRLKKNALRWKRPNVGVFNLAVSRNTGMVSLFEDDDFLLNEGTARTGEPVGNGRQFRVPAVCLDEALPAVNYGVVKIDVEGHEAEVLAGTRRLLKAKRVRDLVFEASWDYHSPAHTLLLGYGYQIFTIEAGFGRPRVRLARSRSRTGERFADYLATINPGRVEQLVANFGWKVLIGG